jgi:glycosyltransferase involved in cell wall biosynthesis
MRLFESVNSNLVCCLTHGDGTNPIVQRTFRSIALKVERVAFLYWDRLSHAFLGDVPNNVICKALMRGCGRRNLRVMVWLPWFWLKAIVSLLSLKPRLVYAHAFEAAVPAYIVHKLIDVEYIYHIHDNISISHNWWPIVRWIFESIDVVLIRGARNVVLPHSCRLLPFYVPYRDKIVILPNTTEHLVRSVTLDASPGRPFTVAAFGSLEETRGLELLLQATKDSSEIRVIAAGHVREKRLLELVMKAPNWDYRGLVPFVEVQDLYAKIDIVYLFYNPDLAINRIAVPIKLPEALSAGRPVLINKEVRVSDQIVQWGVGLSCEYSADSLREQLLSLARNRSLLEKMSSRINEVYDREFSWQKHLPVLLSLVDSQVISNY